MADVDGFAVGLLEESKRFLEKARENSDDVARRAFLHASLNLAFCALEAHVNAVADDFLAGSDDLSVLDRSILEEKRIDLRDGVFEVSNQLQMYRLEERLLYICQRFSKRPLNKQATFWSELKTALRLRNELTHPKQVPAISLGAVEHAILAVVNTLNELYKSVYRARYPAFRRGLDSNLDF